MIEKLGGGKDPNERLFNIAQTRKALRNACQTAKSATIYPSSAAKNVHHPRNRVRGDVKVIAEWQEHRDSGNLILQAYSHIYEQVAQKPYARAPFARELSSDKVRWKSLLRQAYDFLDNSREAVEQA